MKYLGLEGPLAPGRLGQPLPGTKYKNVFLPKKGLDHEAVFRATILGNLISWNERIYQFVHFSFAMRLLAQRVGPGQQEQLNLCDVPCLPTSKRGELSTSRCGEQQPFLIADLIHRSKLWRVRSVDLAQRRTPSVIEAGEWVICTSLMP
jgi:hypothetical protein